MTETTFVGYRPDEIKTREPTRSAKLKWVVIVDAALSPGQAVNAAVRVSAATARAVPGLLGPDGFDASGERHLGLPWAGCSVLAADGCELQATRRQALTAGLSVVDMPAAAQTTRVYDECLEELTRGAADDLTLLAISLIGPRNRVAKVVRKLPLLP
jgi:hypothetical protein